MKKLAACLLACLLSSTIWAQSGIQYRVVRVVGVVESSLLKRTLKPEDVIPEGDHLKFRGKDSYVIIFNPKSGRKKIQGVPDESPRELNILLQSFLKPDHPTAATRGLPQEYMIALQESLRDRVLLLGDYSIDLDAKLFPVKPPANIKAVPTREGKPVFVNVMSGQKMKLDPTTLYGSSKATPIRVVLYYFMTESNNLFDSEEILGNFTPVYADEATLLIEAKSIAESLKGNPADSVRKYVSAYFEQEYAKPQPINLNSWLAARRLLPEK